MESHRSISYLGEMTIVMQDLAYKFILHKMLLDNLEVSQRRKIGMWQTQRVMQLYLWA